MRIFRLSKTMMQFLFGISLCSFSLISCSSSQPSTYLYSADTLGLLTWTPDQGQVTGEMQTDRREDSGTYHNTNTLDGSVDSTTATLRIAGGLVTMTGDVSGDALTLHHVPMSDGSFQTQTWHSGTQVQYQQLTTAFDASIGVESALQTLKAHLALLPPDSDPGSLPFAVAAVQDDISSLSAGVQEVQNAQSPFEKCSAYHLDVWPYLLKSDAFEAPDPQKTTIAQDMALVAQRFQDAGKLPVPSIKGLTTPWQLSAKEEAKQVQPGKDVLAKFTQAASQEQTSLNASKGQYNQLLSGIDISSLQSSC